MRSPKQEATIEEIDMDEASEINGDIQLLIGSLRDQSLYVSKTGYQTSFLINIANSSYVTFVVDGDNDPSAHKQFEVTNSFELSLFSNLLMF